MNKSKKFSLFFEGFALEDVREVLDRCPDDVPVGYIDDEGEPFPVMAVYVSMVPPSTLQEYAKSKLDYRPPTGEQLEELDYDGAREFART
ncbi:hypothetical protein [Trueperella abortisuis]|uniref:Uncharacterized protein n=1 Tax=Trueperella abortisuis TaxID=445930 RepID=A0ABT9PH79_9ACTO|nr:hypothetical protein [Trueperella abortisuis]MDP9832071.1 hypothetical protein [Trueperella abortisuis]